MKARLLASCALGLALAVALPVEAHAAAESDPNERTLVEGRERVVAARERLQKAEAAYRDWRQRKWPRGTKKADLLAEIDAARLERNAAEAAFPELLEAARRGGVPPGTLRPFEDLDAP